MKKIRAVREALARGYCHFNNTGKVVDHDLLDSMVSEVYSLLEAAQPQPSDLVEQIEKLPRHAALVCMPHGAGVILPYKDGAFVRFDAVLAILKGECK